MMPRNQSSQSLVLEAAERIVRASGVENLTVRDLATEAGFGKSTVHEAVGSMSQLRDVLRRRALADLVATVGPTARRAAEPGQAGGAYERLGQWLLDSPRWALLALADPEPGRTESEQPLAALLAGADPDDGHSATPPALEPLGRYARGLVRAACQLLIDLDDQTPVAPVLASLSDAYRAATRAVQ